MGYFFANIIRFFVGETYQLFSVLGILLGVHYIFYGENPKFKINRFIGSILLFTALLVWLHLRLFEPIMEADVNIISATWRRLPSLLNAEATTQPIGGGMIGALLYALSFFLFANIGTYFFIGILTFIGIMSIGSFSYKTLFAQLKSIVGIFFNWIKNIFIKIKNVLQKNIHFDSKNKQAKKKAIKKKSLLKQHLYLKKIRMQQKHLPKREKNLYLFKG